MMMLHRAFASSYRAILAYTYRRIFIASKYMVSISETATHVNVNCFSYYMYRFAPRH